MSAKFSFHLHSQERRRPLPNKIIIGQRENESTGHVMLKFVAYLIFFRERILIEPRLPDDSIPFAPDIVHLDYTLRPTLWVECGDCSVGKLHKLAVKAPEAEIWVIKRSLADAEELRRAMEKENLRQGRYGIIALDTAMFDEMCGLLGSRNSLTWCAGGFDPPQVQFDFNGLWFDTGFTVWRH